MQKWQSNILLWPRSHDLMTHCDTGVFYKDPSVTWANEEKILEAKKSGLTKGGVVTHLGGLSSRWYHLGGLSLEWSITWVVFHQGDLSPGWSLIWVVFGGLSSGWSFIRVVYDLGGLS